MEDKIALIRKFAIFFFIFVGVAGFFLLVNQLPEDGSVPVSSEPVNIVLSALATISIVAGGLLWVTWTFGFDEVYEWAVIAFVTGIACYDIVAVLANANVPFFHPDPGQSFVKIVFTLIYPIYAIVDRFWLYPEVSKK